MRTAAIKFIDRLESLSEFDQVLKGLENDYGIVKEPNLKLATSLKESLAILPVAYFEEFLRTVCTNFIDNLNETTPQIKWTNLPVNIRRIHLFETPLFDGPSKPENGEDDSHQTQIMEQMKRKLELIISPLDSPNSYTLSSEGFISTQSNPNSQTIKMMYRKIGLKDVFNEEALLNEIKSLDSIYEDAERIKIKLDEIVGRRHAVAHGRGLENVTKEEFLRDIKFMEKLAVAISEATEQHYLHLCSSKK